MDREVYALVKCLVNGFFLSLAMPTGLNLVLTFIIIVLAGMLCGFFIGFFHLKFDADIGLSGIMFNLIASGLTIYLLVMFTGDKGVSSSYPSINFPKIHLPIIKDIPHIGNIVSGHNLLTYIGLAIVFLMMFVLNKTTFGLRIRSVGESPEAVSSVGLNVVNLKLIAISISGGLAALGGASLSMGIFTGFVKEMVAGRGFISLSANTLGGTPIGALLVSLLFGFADSISISLQLYTKIPTQFIQMVPYALTLGTLIIYSYLKTKRKLNKVVK